MGYLSIIRESLAKGAAQKHDVQGESKKTRKTNLAHGGDRLGWSEVFGLMVLSRRITLPQLGQRKIRAGAGL